MRCHKCELEVPVDLRSKTQPVACLRCGALLPLLNKPPERDPKEILARWSDNHWLDNYGPLIGNKQVAPAPEPVPVAAPPSPSKDSSTDDSDEQAVGSAMTDDDFRDVDFDPQEIGEYFAPPIGEGEDEFFSGNRRIHLRLDEGHGLGGHHLPAVQHSSAKGGSWLPAAGQLLAYLGVGSLTVGTVMVLVGHYGNNPEWLPTGWLTASAGQMLLFLGVITLVSGGIEQATHEIVQRVDRLGDRILRMEHRHSGPEKPNFAKKRSGMESSVSTIGRLQRRVVELEQKLRVQNRD